MTPQELAHWHYREGAIRREIESLNRSLDGLREGRSDTHYARVQKARRERMKAEHAEPLSSDDVRNIKQSPTRYDGDIESLDEIRKVNTYLLEEARYMVELGEVMQHGQAQSALAAQEQSQQA